MAFQTTGFGVCLWRMIAGIGIGVELVTIDTYVAELVPKHMRGRAFAFNQCVQFAVVPVVAFLSYILVPLTPAGLGRLALGRGDRRPRRAVRLVPAPRHSGKPALAADPWPPGRGRRHHRADRGQGAGRPAAARPLPPPAAHEVDDLSARGTFGEIWQPPYRSRTIMLMVFQFFQTFGFYGFAAWVPTLIAKQVGINLAGSLQYAFIVAIANPFGPLLAMSFADKFERKWQLVGAAVCIGVFGVLFSQQIDHAAADPVRRADHAVEQRAVLLVPQLPVGAVPDPRARPGGRLHLLRSAASARCSPASSSGSSSPQFNGTTGVFGLIAFAMLMVVLSIGIFGPRTSNLELEKISH